MASWKSRFEDLIFEIEGEESPNEIRRRELRGTYISQFWEEFDLLREAYDQGRIKYKEYKDKLSTLEKSVANIKEYLDKVDFDENL